MDGVDDKEYIVYTHEPRLGITLEYSTNTIDKVYYHLFRYGADSKDHLGCMLSVTAYKSSMGLAALACLAHGSHISLITRQI